VLNRFSQCYKDEFYYWEIALFFRKFCFAAIISLVPNNSPFMALGIFFVILVFILLHSWIVPFAYRSTNVLDVAADAMIIVTFLSGILFQTPTYAQYTTSLAITVFLLNVLLTVAYAIVFFKKMIKRNWPTIMVVLAFVFKHSKRMSSLTSAEFNVAETPRGEKDKDNKEVELDTVLENMKQTEEETERRPVLHPEDVIVQPETQTNRKSRRNTQSLTLDETEISASPTNSYNSTLSMHKTIEIEEQRRDQPDDR